MWINNFGDTFERKADAFKWLNDVKIDVDIAKIYCDGYLHYSKNVFGIFDEMFQCYVNHFLPVEYYDL